MKANRDSTDLEWMDMHARVLFPHTANGQLVNKVKSARFYLGRTPQGNFHRVRSDLSPDTKNRLASLVSQEPILDGPVLPPRHTVEYATILAETTPIENQWQGPAYRFPTQIPTSAHHIVQIDKHNIDLLRANHKDWLPDVGTGDPVCALLVAGKVVSVCFSAAMSQTAFEAGLDTLPSHRRRGYAVAVVAFWGRAVRDLGYEPLYSTSSDNLASQATAAKLRLIPIGDVRASWYRVMIVLPVAMTSAKVVDT